MAPLEQLSTSLEGPAHPQRVYTLLEGLPQIKEREENMIAYAVKRK
jgi:hypothetical protein